MDDGESNQDVETNIFRKSFNKVPHVSNVFQPVWIRRSSILSCISNRKFILGKLNFVLYFGTLLWIIFFITKIL